LTRSYRPFQKQIHERLIGANFTKPSNPSANKLRDAQDALDAAYGMKPAKDILTLPLKLNLELAEKESTGESITPPSFRLSWGTCQILSPKIS